MATSSGKDHEISSSECSEDESFSTSEIAKAPFSIQYLKGDLFQQADDEDSLAHCISEDLALGKGIAALFKKKFGGIDELRSQKPYVGDIATLKRGRRHIINLITKEKFWQKPTYKTLENSLISMKKFAEQNEIKKIMMPKIGCGLDQLKWEKVSEIIIKVFESSNISVTVCSL